MRCPEAREQSLAPTEKRCRLDFVEVKKRDVRIRILKPYKSKSVNFAPGEIVWVSQKLADELILADAAEYLEEQIDIEIERITRENPEAITKLNAKLDADIAAGRTQSMETLFEEEDKTDKPL